MGVLGTIWSPLWWRGQLNSLSRRGHLSIPLWSVLLSTVLLWCHLFRNLVVNWLLLWLFYKHVSCRHLRLLTSVLILLLLIFVLRLLGVLWSERKLWWGVGLSVDRLDSLLWAHVRVHEFLWGFLSILIGLFHLCRFVLSQAKFERLDIVNVIDWSTVDINNFSIAYCNSHELLSILYDWVSIEWIFFFLGFIQPRVWAISFISELGFFDFSKVIKFIESWLSDRNDLFYNVPKDTFRAWNSSQRALVSPSSVEL